MSPPPINIPKAVDDVSPSLRILIVEDHDDLADALRTNLRSEGYHASVASDGRQALAMVRADPPDIVVLDLGLPGLDGLALLSRLRAEGHWCPVLILSARDSDSDKVEGFRLGADDYVTKPFRTLELMARVDAMARRVVRELSLAVSSGQRAQMTRAGPRSVLEESMDTARTIRGRWNPPYRRSNDRLETSRPYTSRRNVSAGLISVRATLS